MARRRRPPRAGALSDLQPLKIAAQIATLQALFYAAALILMLFTALVAGTGFGLDLVLGWDRVRGDTTQGWVLAFVWILDGGLCMAIAIVVLIARSKLVPDFALTIHFLHLLLTSLYTRSLPRHAMWWLAMVASSALGVALGMWGCRYRELQPVFFGGGRILGNNPTPAAVASASSSSGRKSGADDHDGDGGHEGGAEHDSLRGEEGAADEEMGLGRGRGRGRRDEYEMGKMESGKQKG